VSKVCKKIDLCSSEPCWWVRDSRIIALVLFWFCVIKIVVNTNRKSNKIIQLVPIFWKLYMLNNTLGAVGAGAEAAACYGSGYTQNDVVPCGSGSATLVKTIPYSVHMESHSPGHTTTEHIFWPMARQISPVQCWGNVYTLKSSRNVLLYGIFKIAPYSVKSWPQHCKRHYKAKQTFWNFKIEIHLTLSRITESSYLCNRIIKTPS
jgi:hypothetical protein